MPPWMKGEWHGYMSDFFWRDFLMQCEVKIPNSDPKYQSFMKSKTISENESVKIKHIHNNRPKTSPFHCCIWPFWKPFWVQLCLQREMEMPYPPPNYQSQMNENFQGCDLLFWMEVRLVVKVCACVRINRRSISINVPLSRAIPGIPFTDQLW